MLAEPNAADLISAYWRELGFYQDKLPLDPDWQWMLEAEAAGRFKVWVCRVDGTVAGFVAFHLISHVAYRGTLFAVDAGHYLATAWRDKGRIGYKLWSSVKPALKAEGVKMAILHDNADRPLMPFFLAIGAEPRSTIFWWDVTE